ncbi:MAG: helix-turn-helix domain-containing protein [Treponema sp.]|jgi:hypothetical protein|nr:helix-turn-helix domain-containing protein [Treponema sp.]
MVKYNTDKGKRYSHFSREEREETAVGLERGESIRAVPKNCAEDPPRSTGKSGGTARF